LRWATVHTSCLTKMGGCNFRALMDEKRAKETDNSPANRLEITTAMFFKETIEICEDMFFW
jgi:hypothetical protein